MATKKDKAVQLVKVFDSTFSAKSTSAFIPMNELKALAAKAAEEGFALVQSKKSKTEYSLYDAAKKSKYASITVLASAPKKDAEEKPKKTKKAKAEKKAADKAPKAKKAKKTAGDGKGRTPKAYTVKYTTKDGKKAENDKLTSCAEIKLFIKDLKKVGLVELKIYNKETAQPTRKSAWISKES